MNSLKIAAAQYAKAIRAAEDTDELEQARQDLVKHAPALREKLVRQLETVEEELEELVTQKVIYWDLVAQWVDEDCTYGMSTYGKLIAEAEGAAQIWQQVLNRICGVNGQPYDGLELVCRWADTRQWLEGEVEQTMAHARWTGNELEQAKKRGRARAVWSALQWMDRVEE